jgi:carboxyl-terminal processing protease
MSPRLRTLGLATLAAVPLVAGGFIWQAAGSHDGSRVFDQVLTLVSERFVDTLDSNALYEKAAQGLVHELNDPYTELLPPKRLTEFSRRTGGRYGGIGMEIADFRTRRPRKRACSKGTGSWGSTRRSSAGGR